MLVSSRTTNILLVLVLAVGVAIVAMLATGVRGGPLDPSQPPGSTLPQVEPRSPIPPVGWNGTFPIVISQPGSYFLNRNLTGTSGQHGIRIDSDYVSLDLNGYSLIGVAGALDAIHSDLAYGESVVIENGSFSGWQGGIDMPNVSASIAHVRGFQFTENVVRTGPATTVRDCNFYGPAGGIVVGTQSMIADCRVQGQDGSNVGINTGVRSHVRDCVVVDYLVPIFADVESLVVNCVSEN